MKKQLAMMCVTLACSAGVSVFAQAKPQMDSKPMMNDGAMTVSGCVATGKDGKGFMLNNAMPVSKMMDKPMDKPMDKAAMKPAGHMMAYELAGADVKAHLGHKVELTGTVSKADMDRMSKMDKMDQMAKDKMMADPMMKVMKLTVTSVKMISATCPS